MNELVDDISIVFTQWQMFGEEIHWWVLGWYGT